MSDTDSHYLGGYEVTHAGDWVLLGGSDREEPPPPPMAPTFWDGLTESARDWFLANGQERRVADGHQLLRQGARPTKVVLLLDGATISDTITERGERGYVDLARSGDLLGAAEAISGDFHPATVRTITAHNRVLSVPLTFLHRALRAQPDITIAFVHALTAQLARTDQLRAALIGPAHPRIAYILLYLAERIGTMSPAGLVITMARADIAAWTGLSIRTVEHVLSNLQCASCITCARRKITITDAGFILAMASAER
ncbi:Crp/Fnr family transcriptional regulator [Sphaerisporangium viridialbum]|uniref:Crp/Fnr family transcriptional regulator n=1 Tax=Sphaerisporangium viridialbum TaxID=46189 RepID=UPI003C7772C4